MNFITNLSRFFAAGLMAVFMLLSVAASGQCFSNNIDYSGIHLEFSMQNGVTKVTFHGGDLELDTDESIQFNFFYEDFPTQYAGLGVQTIFWENYSSIQNQKFKLNIHLPPNSSYTFDNKVFHTGSGYITKSPPSSGTTVLGVVEAIPLDGHEFPNCKPETHTVTCTPGNKNFIQTLEVFHQAICSPNSQRVDITNDVTLVNYGNKECQVDPNGDSMCFSEITVPDNTNRLNLESNQDQIVIYPNPIENGQFTLTSNSSISGIQIFRLTGEQLAARIRYNNEGANVNIQEQTSPGVYLLKYTEAGQNKFRKIVVSK